MHAITTEDPADLFLHLYDALGDEPFRRAWVRAWLRDERTRLEAAQVRDEALGTGKATSAVVEPLVAVGPRGVFAVLLGLDEALEHANPFGGSAYSSDFLGEVLERYAEFGRLNSDPADGLLLFPVPRVGRPDNLPNRARIFRVVRVTQATAAALDFGLLPSGFDVPAVDRGIEPVSVGCVPMLETYDDIDVEPRTEHGLRLYRLTPRAEVVARRVRTVLERLDSSGNVIGVLPEYALSDELLTEWKQTLATIPRPADSSLQWILVGTGPVGGADPPYNRAVLLSRMGGHTILQYDKQFDFTLTPTIIERWHLDLGSDTPLMEDISLGEGLVVRDSALGRIAFLICEDLGRLIKLGGAISELGISLLFVPIFDQPLRDCGWVQRSGDLYATGIGARTIVVTAAPSGARCNARSHSSRAVS